MEPGFREKGYDDLDERVAIARNLIDRLYRMLDKVAAAPGFSHVRVVDLRGTLSTELPGNKYKTSWDNELHPSATGSSRSPDCSTASSRRRGRQFPRPRPS